MILSLNIEAFTLSDAFRQSMERAAQDPTFGRSRIDVHDGGIVSAVAHYAHSETPSLLIVEEDGDDAALFAHLAELAGVCSPTTKVVVVGALNDITLYRDLISQGISEYLVLPLSPRDIVDGIGRIYAAPGRAPKGRMIACRGSRGGVGSSTTAANLAWALADLFGEAVVLVDLDLQFGTAALSFNLGVKNGVLDAVTQGERLDQTLLERYIQAYGDHLSIITAPAQLQGMPTLTVEGLDKFLDMVRQMFSFVVLDLPHGWAPWMPTLMGRADELLLTTSPDLAAVRDSKNFADAMKGTREGSEKLKVVVNKRGAFADGELTAKDFEETMGLKPLIELPNDPALFLRALNNGRPVGEVGKGEKVAKEYRALAQAVAGRKTPAGAGGKASGKSGVAGLLGGLDLQGLFKKAK